MQIFCCVEVFERITDGQSIRMVESVEEDGQMDDSGEAGEQPWEMASNPGEARLPEMGWNMYHFFFGE